MKLDKYTICHGIPSIYSKYLFPLIDINTKFKWTYIKPQDFILNQWENSGTCWDSVYKMYNYLVNTWGIIDQRVFIWNNSDMAEVGSHAYLLVNMGDIWVNPEFTLGHEYNGFKFYSSISEFVNQNVPDNIYLDPSLLKSGMTFNQVLDCKINS